VLTRPSSSRLLGKRTKRETHFNCSHPERSGETWRVKPTTKNRSSCQNLSTESLQICTSFSH
jgi:hypothetical protein